MHASKTSEISGQVFGVIIFAIAALMVAAIAKRKAYFTFSTRTRTVNINLKVVLSSFFLYLLINALILPIILNYLSPFFLKYNIIISQGNLALLSLINVINNVLVILFLGLISLLFIKDQITHIWKEEKPDHFSTYTEDIKIGIASWFIAFPIVMFCSNFFELLLKLFLSIKDIPDQIAIEYVKMAQGNLGYFIIALITVVLFAPLIEEYLFRGLLQNYLRKFFGIKGGIIIASVFFAIFHFSAAQGYSNITILLSLFVLSLFLGFVYERQQSLISPIILHATFNAISVFNLMLFKDP